MKNAGRYYRWLVVVQTLMFIVAITVSISAPNPRLEKMNRCADEDIKGGLTTMLEMFRSDCGRYPTTSESLRVLASAPTDGSLTNWRGPYVAPPRVPLDPWGHEYCYHFPALHSTNAYDLYSLGPDGISKTGGNDADDIGNWEKPLRSQIFDTGFLFHKIQKLPLVIPILFVIRLIVGFISPRFRTIADENQWADWVWFGMTVLILVMLCIPKISGRVG
jgi:general secretion pathway protein G